MFTRPRKHGIKDDQLIVSGEIMLGNRILALFGPIGASAIDVMYDLRLLAQESKDPIKIEIISPGGDIFSCLALYHVMSALNQSGIPIYTVGHLCYSAAAIILAAGEKGHRYIYPEGTVMLHSAAVGASGGVRQADLKILEKNDRILVNLISKLCGKSKKEQEKLYKEMVEGGMDFWFDAKEAKEFGLIDHIVTPKTDRKLFGNLVIPSWEEARKITKENTRKSDKPRS